MSRMRASNTLVALGAGRRRPALPRVVPAGGDPQQPAHRGDGIEGPVGSHELEDPDGIEPVCLREPGRGFCQYLALLAQPAVLTPEPPQLLALGTGQAVM